MDQPPSDAHDAVDAPVPTQASGLASDQATPVVGLGASAGGLRALQVFFDHMPPESGMAFVVILHLSPEHESQAAALLQTHTRMPVAQVVDTMPIRANHVYVIPPAKRLVIINGSLHLEEPETEAHRRVPIDHFFRTLADTHDRRAIAIILSGSGSDGSLGLKRIKEYGGTIFVQDPQEAEFDAMPRSAIATGLADFVLPVAAMPAGLNTYHQSDDQVEILAGESSVTVDDAARLHEILALLKLRTGHDFSQYKRPTLIRRVGRRMQVLGVPDLTAYIEALRSRPDEVQELLQDLLISVTNFFRDKEAWIALEAIIPLLFAQRAPGKGPPDQVRVWVTACATGEEAYSVAMLLQEYASTLDQPPAIQVFASDIDDQAIAQARQARYPEEIAADVSPERLRQFFVFEQGRYRIKEELRQLVLFAHHNVLRDPPFSRLDLITCRNLLIYLNHTAQEQVTRLFHFSLRPGGYLLLGNAESLDGVPELFNVVAKAQRLFQQRPVHSIEGPLMLYRGRTRFLAPAHETEPARKPPQLSVGALHERLLLAHAPPSAIVNQEYEIVHLSRGANRFLQMEGEPSVNLLRAAHPDLRLELRTMLFQAAQQGGRIERRHVRVTLDTGVRLVDLVVEPVEDEGWPRGYLLVLLSDSDPASADEASDTRKTDMVVHELEAEVHRLRQQLQSTVEAYETTGEEFIAANEELQAINEEARVASEELETSKEELQAVNEELSTINQELKHKVTEISQANNDLQNLIAATQIGTLFIDRELRLTRYTPKVEAIFNVIPADLNRPLGHLTHHLQYEHLVADATQVLTTLMPIEHELLSTTGQGYLVQLRPYRTSDERIAGVVITFVDITERQRAEATLAERARLLDLSNDAIVVRDAANRVIYWNHGATDMYGWTRDEALGQDLHTLLQTEFEAPMEQLLTLLEQHNRMEGEVEQRTKDGRRIVASSRWALDRDSTGRPGAILTTYNDITDRKQAEAEQQRLLQETVQARHEAEAALQVRDKFLSIASHELRTPLTSLMGYTSMLQARLAADDTADATTKRQLGAIERQTTRLNTLIGHLLDISRLQHGQFMVVPQSVDLGPLVAQLVEEFRLTMPDGAMQTLTLVVADKPVLVHGDPARLEEVVTNLLSNAIKYSPDGGAVEVRVELRDTEAILEVSDQGLGIPLEAQQRLFEPFYRATNVGSQTSGFGIGLYVVKEIVQRHGGRIDVESAEGAGTCFRVRMPRLEAHGGSA